MRILRIRLRNYRGTAQREVLLAENAITLVAGPNESGKSSLVEAVHLAMNFRDNSRAAAVRAVQPVGTDLPTEVEVEMRIGSHHFVLLRRWHRDTSTRLTVLSPTRQDLAGREADEWLERVRSEELDTDLLDALHMGQDDRQLAQAVPNPWGGALADALTVGKEEAGARLDTTLLDLASAERARWLTRTGKEKKELKFHTDAVAEARNRVEEIRRLQDDLEGCISEHERAGEDLASVRLRQKLVGTELEGLSLRRAKIEEAVRLRDLRRAEAAASGAEARNAEAAWARREELVERLTGLQERIDALAEEDASGGAARDAAGELAARLRNEADHLAARAAEAEMAAATAEGVARRADLAEQLAIAEGQLAVARATADPGTLPSLTIEALKDLVILQDGEAAALAAGGSHQQVLGESTRLEIAGILRLVVEPGEAAVAAREKAEQAAAVLTGQLESRITQLGAELTEAGGDPGVSPTEARATAGEAAAEARQLASEVAAAETAARRAEAEAAELLADHRQRAELLAQSREYVAGDAAELARQREEADDDTLRVQAADARTAADEAGRRLSEAQAQVDDLSGDSLVERVDALERELAGLDRSEAELRDRLTTLAERARLLSDRGLHTRLQEAEAELDEAVARESRERRKAQVADLLFKTLDQHRAQAESAYQDPLRLRIEELGRKLLGPSFAVEMGPDLTVARRRLDGKLLDVAELSAGAREQIALLGRVACASLAARDGAGAPLVLDDTLGFTDPERRETLARLLAEATAGCQVIILTCDPQRFAGLTNATLVELESSASATAEATPDRASSPSS